MNRTMAPLTPIQWAYLRAHRVGHLATANRNGAPTVVPICFADDGSVIYSALDSKPKRVAPTHLQRVRNIQENPAVALLVDDYAEDWTQLSYLLIHAQATLVAPGTDEHARAVDLLRQKYAQYAGSAIADQPILRLEPTTAKSWSGRKQRR